ncbi:MCM7 [Giardia lamblia P15]|uniref:MCM7 n=1 Tax=Giardia intestinalis (strain P15) TaxID=658858 RepID=E1F2H4_GIAIA|nr:MCM7 [Giardia lamblia P15]
MQVTRTQNLHKEFSNYRYREHADAFRELIREQALTPIHGRATVVHIYLKDLPVDLAACIKHNFPHYSMLINDVLTEQWISSLPEEERGQYTNQPYRLSRWFSVEIIPENDMLEHPLPLRSVSASMIGHLVVFSGIVTFISQVVPECEIATFTCEVCGSSQYVVVPHDQYSIPQRCDSEVCQQIKTYEAPVLNTKRSAINSLYIVIIQELPAEIPDGEVPRTMTVHIRREGVTLRPGEKVKLWGTLMPIPVVDTIYRINSVFYAEGWTYLNAAEAIGVFGTEQDRAAVLANTMVESSQIHPSPNNELSVLREKAIPLHVLIASFAPRIHGREDEKLACLCSLVGGNEIIVPDMKIRGNINALFVGDPGCAKSALLKFTCTIAERGIYVAGRGASGAGLTTAAIRIPGTTDYSLEGGALVIADQGVCALDELDKLEEADRTAIYEVMEQGTISVAKAGITATLNARATVVAAANPKFSIWDPSISVASNINIPEALISRFDILFVIRDKIHEEEDMNLSLHVANLHKYAYDMYSTGTSDAQSMKILTEKELQTYISVAKSLRPSVPQELLDTYVMTYIQDRKEREFITPRALLATIRISQAIAKLRLSDSVSADDVAKARDLLAAAEKSAHTGRRKQRVRPGSEMRTANRVITSILGQHVDAIDHDTLQELALREHITDAEFQMALTRLINYGLIVITEDNKYKLR